MISGHIERSQWILITAQLLCSLEKTGKGMHAGVHSCICTSAWEEHWLMSCLLLSLYFRFLEDLSLTGPVAHRLARLASHKLQ